MSSISPSSAFADSIVHEMLVEVLSHDIDVWGGSGREDGTDFNAELQLSPVVGPVLAKAMTPKLDRLQGKGQGQTP